MDLRIVVSTQLILLFGGPAAKRLGDIALGILAADHEADLAGRVGRDGCVGIFDGWEDFHAILLQLGDEREVEPLVLSYLGEGLAKVSVGII